MKEVISYYIARLKDGTTENDMELVDLEETETEFIGKLEGGEQRTFPKSVYKSIMPTGLFRPFIIG